MIARVDLQADALVAVLWSEGKAAASRAYEEMVRESGLTVPEALVLRERFHQYLRLPPALHLRLTWDQVSVVATALAQYVENSDDEDDTTVPLALMGVLDGHMASLAGTPPAPSGDPSP